MPDIYDLDDNLLQIIFDEQDNNHYELYNKLLISKICHPNLFTNLTINSTYRHTNFKFIPKYNNLYKIDLSYQKIEAISILPINLTYLNLSKCKFISNFSYLSELNNLQDLNLSNTAIVDLSILPISLITLNLRKCFHITDFSYLSKLNNLQILDLSNNYISRLYLPPNLITLKLERCIFGTHNISSCIYELKKLESLNLTLIVKYIYKLPENLKTIYINRCLLKCELPKKCKLNPTSDEDSD